MLVSFSGLFSHLSHFSSVTPSQPTLTIFFLKSSQKTPKHLNKLPKNSTTKKPHRHHQIALCKSYLKPRKKNPLQSHRTPTKKPKNQHRKIPKTSLKITIKYNQKKKKTEKNSFQNPENQS